MTIIQKSKGYETLLSFKKATIIYDGTVFFCRRYLSSRDRTVDQMIQAARSGKQNIAEGSLAGATSKEMEIKLTNVARASLGELLIDYQDYARVNKIRVWSWQEPMYQRLKELNRDENADYNTFVRAIEDNGVEITVNTMLFLIDKAMYLLYRQMEWLERDFVEHGGVRERMSAARRAKRGY